MDNGYRSGALRCPECSSFLQQREARGATIDVCLECGGLWIDWFDGELSAVARKAEALPVGRAPGDGSNECPRCRISLTSTEYCEQGPLIFRCGECVGAFVPRRSLDELARVALPRDEAEPKWPKFRAWLHRWLGGGG